MKLSLSAVIFSSLILGCYASVALERFAEIPGHSGQCYDNDMETFYNKGQEMKWDGKECGRKLCEGPAGSNRVAVEVQFCPKSEVPPGCVEITPPDLPYPACCKNYACSRRKFSEKVLSKHAEHSDNKWQTRHLNHLD